MTDKEIESKAIETCPSKLDMPTYAQGFVDGAKFGYNKANEWHYVKDGDLPKENENVLIYFNRANHIGFYHNGFWFTNSDGCLEDDDIEVIAWKEIDFQN